MKKVHKNIDDIFKHGLDDPIDEIGFENRDWDALEEMLDKGKKPRRIVYWLPVLSSVAALLLIVFGWWMLKPAVTDDTEKPQVTNVTKTQPQGQPQKTTTGTETITPAGKAAEGTNPGVITNQGIATVKRIYTPNAQEKPFEQTVVQSVNEQPVIANANNHAFTPGNDLSLPKANSAEVKIATPAEHPVIAARTLASPVIAQNINNGPEAISNKWADDEKPGKSKPIRVSTSGFKPQLALSVIAASELNGTNAVSQSNRGSNLGLLFSVGIKKLTITTGAMYSVKPYSANGGAYYSYASSSKYGNTPAVPQNIAVDCRMLDIPLNIDYQLYNKRNNKFSIGTGLSSYIMTHESYEYTYADPSVKAPAEYYVKSPGRYLFSVMNLQATYQRQLNSKIGVSVQPYFKVPLSSIGYSQVKLQSLGVAVGLNWNINSLSKPK